MVVTSDWGDFEMIYPSSQEHDFAIYTPDGREVWRWSDGKAFLDVITDVTYTHDEGKLYFTRFNTRSDWAKLEIGKRYILQGSLPAKQPGPAFVCTAFEVIDGAE